MMRSVPTCLRAGVLYLLVLAGLALPGRAQHATATIHFDQPGGPVIGRGAFGLNLFQGFDPGQSGTPGNAAYKEAMAFMNPGMVRYHSWEMLGPSTNRNGWLTADNGWDAAKIKNALDGAPAYPLVLMNIPGWPSAWGDAEGRLLPERYADYAQWCATLLRIINVDQARGIKYWEITNERDDVYKENSDELGRIFTQAAAAMKAVDPTIKTGGAAFARPDLTAQVNAFFSTAAPALDFVSYHSYANGTPNSPTQQVYDRAVAGGLISADVRREFAKHSSREIEFFHNEFNISWNPPDPHQSTYVSMLFDAILTITAVKSGATGTMAWNECDGWYGKMDNSYNKRPAAYLYHNFNAHLPGGTVCNTTVSNDASLVVLATQQGSLRKFVVVNRADADQRYAFTFTGLPAGVDNSTLFAVSQNLPGGAIATKDLSYGQLTATGGALFEKNTVTILTIDLDNLRSTGDLEVPSAPTNLAAGVTDRTLTLHWTAATDNVGVAGYDVYRDGVPAGSTDGSTTQFAFTWLEPSTTYAFAVVARDATGNASAPGTLTATTTPYAARPEASVFTPTSWNNPFGGNVVNDAGQTTTAGGGVQLAQDEELRIRLINTGQYTNIYQVAFTNPVDLTINAELKVNIRSNAALSLRVKLFDAAGNSMDFWQNTLYPSSDNQPKTYTLNFAANGFGTVDRTRVKGLVFMYADGTPANGTLYLDNLTLGTPNAYAGLRNPDSFINTVGGLDYAYYEGSWNLLPDFATLTPAETGTVAGFDLTPKNRNDNYAFQYTGYVQVPTDGLYTFYTTSDDGSKLYIGDTQVVDNDGLHGNQERSGTIGLRAGKHAIRVTFMQGLYGANLSVSYAGPGLGKQVIPATALFRASDAYVPNPVPSVFTATSWQNAFAGNVPSDAGQTTTAAGNTQLAQDEELRLILSGVTQYTPVYGSTFTSPIDLGLNAEFKIDIRSSVGIALRVKLLDAAGNSLDAWQNTLYVPGDNLRKTYSLNLSSPGFGGVDGSRIKGLVLMYPDATPLTGTLYLDNLQLGTPTVVVDYREPENPTHTTAGVAYSYYEGTWNSLPDFSALTAAKTGSLPNFSLAARNRNDHFGFRYTGFVRVPADGVYAFFTSSDDGSKLYIGDQEVVNNDGLHGMVEKGGSIALKAGLHAIAVTFFEQGGGEGLEVRYAGPNLPKQLIPDAALFRLNPVAVSGLSPASGRTGTPVVIRGSALAGATAVTFNGVAADRFTVDNPGQVTAVVPAGATTGPVRVTTPDGAASSADDFTVLPNAVTTAPVAGAPFCPGAALEVSFTAEGLFAAGNVFTAQLSNAAGNFTSPAVLGTGSGTTGGTLAATLPEGLAAGTGYRVRVVSSDPAAAYTDNGEDLIVIALQTFYADRDGDGYGNAASTTRACTAPAGYVAAAGDCNDANAAVQPGAAEICGNGVDDNCNGQTDEACAAISGFAPAAGPAGTFVVISGKFLGGATAVTFNGTPAASFAVNAAGQVTAVVPAGATSGVIRVTVPGGTVASATAFTVQSTYPKPAVAGFSPGSGPVGTSVTITGSGFYAGVTTVAFNGKAAVTEVLSGTALRAVVPAGATSGRISVRTPGGTATSKNKFTVTAPTARAGAAGEVPLRFRVSPNPFAGAPTLHPEGPVTGPVSVVVFDGYGRVVFRTAEVPATGTLRLDPALPAGVYYLQIRHGETVQTVKALKQ